MFIAAGRVLTMTTAAMALAAAVSASIPAAAAARPSAQGGAALRPQTKTDLMNSMRIEAYARATYTLFAEQAQQQRMPGAARLFQRTAQAMLSRRFTPEAALYGLAGSSAADLRSAIAADSKQARNRYTRFARQATADGNSAAAALFARVARDETARGAAFSSALAAVRGAHGTIPAAPKVTQAALSTGSLRILSLRTLHHLRMAMRNAAFASAEYASYAARATAARQGALAQLFAGAAAAELQGNFAAEAALAGTVCQTQCNLRAAVHSSHLQARVRYPVYARLAALAGDTRAARLFGRDAADAAADAFAFRLALAGLRVL